ncbi:carbohydrate sulfotransferase 12-like [Convolutriloba macropyga]|uniref:carbohydrate sulfotransferase 12-like n=1 Tax=Convolutriloba macropyga TaxID=536237 RepID=UPI003F528FB4
MWTLNHNETAFNEAKYVHPFRDKYVTLLKGLSVDDIRTKLDSYTKFLFVRDPISRFISGYIGKIRSQKLDYLNSVKKARIAANETDQNKPLSFRAFAEYVATLADRGRHIRNAHFSGCLNFCEVCFVNYSFIGRTETMNRDFIYLATELTSMHERAILPPEGGWESRASKHMDLLFELRHETVAKILKLFEYEFEAFGYNPQDVWKFLRR